MPSPYDGIFTAADALLAAEQTLLPVTNRQILLQFEEGGDFAIRIKFNCTQVFFETEFTKFSNMLENGRVLNVDKSNPQAYVVDVIINRPAP